MSWRGLESEMEAFYSNGRGTAPTPRVTYESFTVTGSENVEGDEVTGVWS